MNQEIETGPPTIDLRLLIFKEDGLWIAQCLEFDVAAQAHTLKDVKYEFERLLVGHVVASLENGLIPFKTTPPAPTYYWDMFDSACDRLESEWPEFQLPPGTPPAYMLPKRPSEVRVVA